MTPDEKQQILQSYIEQLKKSEPPQGRKSEMKCPCGGPLVQTSGPNMWRVLAGTFACETCHRRFSTTSALAHNIFQVQPMPQGAALLCYDKLPTQLAQSPEDEADEGES